MATGQIQRYQLPNLGAPRRHRAAARRKINLSEKCTIGIVVPERSDPLESATPGLPEPLSRLRALTEVVLCSGYPTQIAIAAVLFGGLHFGPSPDGHLTPQYIVVLLALDTALLLGLMWAFLRRSGERPRDVFVGWRRPADEAKLGLLTVPPILVLIAAIQLVLRVVAPSLHNVPTSPFAGLMDSPWTLAGFLIVLIVAGGVREELQRAFLLRRFEEHLGGAGVGLVITSLAFGLGHTLQGWDAALGTAILGAFWGVMYLARRSTVGTITSHAIFNTIQAVMGYLVTTTN
jgi:membrane protease YdiL (CAAX protease family)